MLSDCHAYNNFYKFYKIMNYLNFLPRKIPNTCTNPKFMWNNYQCFGSFISIFLYSSPLSFLEGRVRKEFPDIIFYPKTLHHLSLVGKYFFKRVTEYYQINKVSNFLISFSIIPICLKIVFYSWFESKAKQGPHITFFYIYFKFFESVTGLLCMSFTC